MSDPDKLGPPLDEETWEDEEYRTHASVYKTDKTEGIAIKTENKNKTKWNRWHKSFWLQKDEDVNGLLNWLFGTIKRQFARFWGKEIITPEEIQSTKNAIHELEVQLAMARADYKELEMRYESQLKEVSLAKELIEHLDEYERVLNNFENKISTSVKNNERIEEWVKAEIQKNRWLLGLDCEVKAKNKPVDTQTGIDMHIQTNYGEDRIIEVKSPNLKIFRGEEGKRHNISPDLAEGLSELVEYLERTESYSLIKQQGVYKIEKPVGRILAGYALDDDQERLLKDWNFYLSPVIKIITYKELINNAKKELELIKITRKTS